MAFTFCENCGEKIDIADTKCPHCGCKRGGEGEYIPPERDNSYSYGSTDNDTPLWKTPDQQNGGAQGAPRGGMYTPPPYGDPRYGPRPFVPYRPRIKRPVSKGLAIFSGINIFLGLFCLVGLIFGALALAQVISAQSAINEVQEINKKKTALVLNIIGTSLTVINIVAFIVGFMLAGGAAAATLAIGVMII